MSNTMFLINHDKRDFYSDVQRTMERIGDVGKESEGYTKAAYSQFRNKGFNDLAKDPDQFTVSDPMRGTQGREGNRNYNRMEYDPVERNDDKSHSDVMKKVIDKQVEMGVDYIKNAFKNMGYTLNTSASAIGSSPILPTDLEDQITD